MIVIQQSGDTFFMLLASMGGLTYFLLAIAGTIMHLLNFNRFKNLLVHRLYIPQTQDIDPRLTDKDGDANELDFQR